MKQPPPVNQRNSADENHMSKKDKNRLFSSIKWINHKQVDKSVSVPPLMDFSLYDC